MFFIKKTLEKLLKTNPKVLIMNPTYKTNRYKLPLLIISEVTTLNTSFYIAFGFILHETADDYV